MNAPEWDFIADLPEWQRRLLDGITRSDELRTNRSLPRRSGKREVMLNEVTYMEATTQSWDIVGDDAAWFRRTARERAAGLLGETAPDLGVL